MASDYEAIRSANRREYGEGIGRFGQRFLVGLYADRTHFIFELLQNAEDAIGRRGTWEGPRSVVFRLSGSELRVSHQGEPFNEDDVRGICGIDESTKTLTEIGRFGIGFKSVYAFSARPEVHSGAHDFAIENFVLPVAVPPIARSSDDTVIVLPLDQDGPTAFADISRGLKTLGLRTLLFLRQIERIEWHIGDAACGAFERADCQDVDPGVRRVRLVGETSGQDPIEECWLVFSTELVGDGGVQKGRVEVAFLLGSAPGSTELRIQRLGTSPLVVFFPTVVDTNLGFLVQGPYRTTPSRDTVPPADAENQWLVQKTGDLLVTSLRWLREHDLLDMTVVRCLPLDAAKFTETVIVSSLFERVKAALSSDRLLPRYDGGHVTAAAALIARTQDLRDLLSPSQLGTLWGASGDLAWLAVDTATDLQQYLKTHLRIQEVTADTIIPKLTSAFLETQSDEWTGRLYEFLNGQPALLKQARFREIPLVRLENGGHTQAQRNGKLLAYLPSREKSGFPTVRRAVLESEEARSFLRKLGLEEPDPVDDVIENILSKYRVDTPKVADSDYARDIELLVKAYATDSDKQRKKLVDAAGTSAFVRAVTSDGALRRYARPSEVYVSPRLRNLFEGVPEILLFDDSVEGLRQDGVQAFLEGAGATRYLVPTPVPKSIPWPEQCAMRKRAGCEDYSSLEAPTDHTLRGLDALLSLFPSLGLEARTLRSNQLWDTLVDLLERRGKSTFSGQLAWVYHRRRTAEFDAAFVETLKRTAWVPGPDGVLVAPGDVVFATLGWKVDATLESKLGFRSPLVETLARAFGLPPAMLVLLKQSGKTLAELEKLLGPPNEAPSPSDAVAELLGGHSEPEPPSLPGSHSTRPGDGQLGSTKGADAVGQSAKSALSKGAPQPFISYTAAHPTEEEPDPDGLEYPARMALERSAIELILAEEPVLQPTPPGNAGFDLFEADDDGTEVRWVEVKAMTGSLDDRPVGLSHTQFEHATKQRGRYWLYVVEHAGDPAKARIVRIDDPAGRTKTFTFDHGWRSVAVTDTDHIQEEA